MKYCRALMRLNYGYGVNILSNHTEVSLLFVPFLSELASTFRVLLFFLPFRRDVFRFRSFFSIEVGDLSLTTNHCNRFLFLINVAIRVLLYDGRINNFY